MSKEGQQQLDEAMDVLEREAPNRVSRAVRWLRARLVQAHAAKPPTLVG